MRVAVWVKGFAARCLGSNPACAAKRLGTSSPPSAPFPHQQHEDVGGHSSPMLLSTMVTTDHTWQWQSKFNIRIITLECFVATRS